MFLLNIIILFCISHASECKQLLFLCEYGETVTLSLCGNSSCISFENSYKYKLLCSLSDSRKETTKEVSTSFHDTVTTCPPINGPSILVKCFFPENQVTPCNTSLPQGSLAYVQCRPYYVTNTSKNVFKKIKCMGNGNWNSDIPICRPDCGKTDSEIIPLILKGWIVKRPSWPWHATLYKLEDGNWDFFCGGSLISEKVVITAAHCVWQMSPRDIKVALGKYIQNLSSEEVYAQIKRVDNIIIQPLYQDLLGNYGSDIALLVLREPVKFSTLILPVCIGWTMHDITEDLSRPKLGVVLGMGVTENNTISKELRASSMAMVENENCIAHQTSDFQKYVTHTSFCAGWINGSGVCNGDSGGGLVFRNSDEIWELEGIVSISPKRLNSFLCNPNYYSIFTKVGLYINWIKQVLVDVHGQSFVFI